MVNSHSDKPSEADQPSSESSAAANGLDAKSKAESASPSSWSTEPSAESPCESRIEEELRRLKRALRALSACNQALAQAHSEQELLDQICDIIVRLGGYRMAGILYAEPDEEKTVRPMAQAGHDNGYFETIHVKWSDTPAGRGPAGTAIRENRICVITDTATDPKFASWREVALKRGYAAVIALPLRVDGLPFGVLGIYSGQRGSFESSEVELLSEIASSLAYGITAIRSREEHRRATAALQEAEAKYRQLVEQVPAISYLADTGALGAFHYLSPQAQGILGYHPRDCTSNPFFWWEHLNPEDRPIALAEDSWEEGRPFQLEYRMKRQDGQEVWIRDEGMIFRDPETGKRMTRGLMIDITKQKRTEEALRQSQQRLQQVIRVSQIGIFDHDHLADTIYWSPEQRNIYGFGPDEVVTLPVYFQRVYPGDREAMAVAVRRAHDPAGDGLFDVDHRIVRRDGAIRWLSTRSQTFFEDKGAARHPVRTIGAVWDITERKHSEQALREAEEKYREIFDHAVIGIFQSTPDGRYLSVNKAMARMNGYRSPEEMVAMVTDIERLGYVQPSRRLEFKHLLEEQGVVRDFTFEFHRKDGSRGWALVNARAVRDAQRTVIYYEGTQDDITERMRLEAQYQHAQKMEVVGRLAGGVAHDFNNLLGVIIGYSEHAAGRLDPTHPVMRSISKIKQAAERAASLTKQLLAFSRQQVIYPRILDLNKVVGRSAEMMERLVGEDVKVTFKPGAQLGFIKADPGQIEQILMNLAVNARDAMATGGKIMIETANVELDEDYVQQHPLVLTGPYIMLTFADTGCGIDQETLPHIFEPFFTTKAPGKGTGLGLATVYGIVKQNNGYIWAHSERNEGTMFKIYLPRVEEVESPFEPDPEAESQGGSETILLVEDEAALREVTASLLETAGYKVLRAESAPAALVVARAYEGKIDLLLTDVIMPVMSGVELYDRLVKSRPATRLLYMSGYAGDQLSHYGQFDPRSEILQKPFTRKALLKKLRAVLAS